MPGSRSAALVFSASERMGSTVEEDFSPATRKGTRTQADFAFTPRSRAAIVISAALTPVSYLSVCGAHLNAANPSALSCIRCVIVVCVSSEQKIGISGILAGAFANVAAVMGGRESTVNLGLSLVPVEFLAAGLFVISAFMGTATGSSMGTVTAVIPIAVGIAEKGGLSLTVVIGAVVGGAMFGDNLSMISDTTIAATRSQRCEMRDKFRVNFLIALPAALITLVLLLIFGRPETVMPLEALPFDLIKVLPYVLVLVLALCGLNVFLALTVGIFSAGLVGICCGDLTIAAFAQSVWDGFTGMNEVFFLTLLCGGMSELIAKNGGIAWIIQKLRKVMKGNKSAQVGIAAMVSLCDCATANNTVAIVMANPIAHEMAETYNVSRRKTASILDTFSCLIQGIIPYGAQLLIAAGLAGISPISIIGSLYYPFTMGICALLAILVRYPRKYS